MTVHSFHIFDRHGKRLFYKRYLKSVGEPEETPKQQDDQLKLMFGMLLSLRELCGKLSPNDDDMGDVQLVKTGAACLYNFETVSGLRFVLYTTAETSVGRSLTSASTVSSTTTPTSSATANNNNIITAAASTITTTTPILASATTGMGLGTTTTTTSSTTHTPIASPPSSNPNSVHGNIMAVPNTTSTMTNPAITAQIRHSLQYIYEHLWVTYVVRSPLYRPPHHPNLEATNFEVLLDQYLKGMPWFR